MRTGLAPTVLALALAALTAPSTPQPAAAGPQGAPATAPPRAAEPAPPPAGAQSRYNLQFRSARLDAILRALAEAHGANLAVTGELDTVMTANLSSLTLPDALEALLGATRWTWTEEAGLYRVVPGGTVVTRIVPLRYSNAGQVAEVLRAQLQDVTINAEPRSNSVLASGPVPRVREVARLLADIDHSRPQVRIRAEMVEVSLTDSDVRGVDLDALLSGRDADARLRTAFGDVLDPSTLKVHTLQGDLEVTGILAALRERRKAALLSSPEITTLDNQPARIHVGERVPYQRATTETQTGATLAEVEFLDVGVKLEVTPTVSDDSTLYLQLHSEVSEVLDQSVQNVPRIGTREADTRVMVRHGDTVVIGGLIRDNITRTTKKFPVLGDIPLLGLLFRRDTDVKTKTELLVFIHPCILPDPADLRPTAKQQELRDRFTPEGYREDADGTTGGRKR
jgi:type II secretory pathway component GspD/PulD (secretin)